MPLDHLLAAVVLALPLPPAGPAPGSIQEREVHLRADEVARIQAAQVAACNYLLRQQAEDGSVRAAAHAEFSKAALTALVLWGWNEVSDVVELEQPRELALAYLMARRQPDGGIYDPGAGLAIYTSGVAMQALRSSRGLDLSPEFEAAQQTVDLYVYRGGAPESEVDAVLPRNEADRVSRDAAARVLEEASGELTAAERLALEFVVESSAPGHLTRRPSRLLLPRRGVDSHQMPFSYDDLLPFIYAPLDPQVTTVHKCWGAIRRKYTLERNPDLTERYGADGFQRGTQGLFYYYLVLARCLAAYRDPQLTLADGSTRDWVRELAGELIRRQRSDGSWVNEDPRWWEGEPTLVTSYALLALDACLDVGGSSR